MIIEVKPQLSTEDLSKRKNIIPSLVPKEKGKGVEASINEIDLNEDIVNPNWDTCNITPKEMDTLGEIWKKREKQKKL